MYQEVATKFFIPAAGTFVLRAFAMNGGNAVQVEYEVVTFGATVRVSIDEGNDLQNWKSVAVDADRFAIGSFQFVVSGIASRYARVVVSGAGSVIEACINTQRL